MKRFIKKIIKNSILKIAKCNGVVVTFGHPNFNGYSDIIENKYGHKLSRERGLPCDCNAKPLPWFTYPAIEYLNQLDLSKCNIFEWGIGNSSLFFAERAFAVYSVENDEDWFNKIQSIKLSNNHIYLEKDNNKYAQIISTFNMKFDIIVIDGKEREKCSNISHLYLVPEGLIILDNSDRHPDIAEKFRELDFLQVDMHGLGPINHYTWTTSFFFKRAACFKPKANQPTIPIGGGY